MMILLSQIWLKVMPFAFALAEEAAQAFDFTPMGVWRSMGWVARIVLVILLVMSIWSMLSWSSAI